jgi:histidinol dehydrogenase
VRLERLAISQPEDAASVAAEARSLVAAPESVRDAVAAVVARVRNGGDAELNACIREFDTGGAEPPSLRVSSAELEAALGGLDAQVRAGLMLAIDNVSAVALAGLGEDVEVVLEQGQSVLVREIPVRRAAIYVPGGRAPYPSTVVMGAVTARVAGVEQVVVCSPPGPDGDIHPAILGACALCGVDEVLRMGGAHAVAALAWGTETVRRVDVIAGPGNLYVQEAKRLAFGQAGIDGFQGPSDLLVVLDTEEESDLELVALDLLAQAEHGPDSLVLAVSTSAEAVEALARRLEGASAVSMPGASAVSMPGASAVGQSASADPGAPPGVCAMVSAGSLEAALALAEAFAPEHLQLVGDGAEALAPQVRSAGCLLVGSSSGTAFADYVAGSNHILPTAGAARHSSALSVRQFRRRMAQVEVGPAAPELARAAAPVARAEGFEFHARSMEARIAARAAEVRENRVR